MKREIDKSGFDKDLCLNIIFHAVLFILFMLFFIKMCPNVLFDGDDWTYIGVFTKLPGLLENIFRQILS